MRKKLIHILYSFLYLFYLGGLVETSHAESIAQRAQTINFNQDESKVDYHYNLTLYSTIKSFENAKQMYRSNIEGENNSPYYIPGYAIIRMQMQLNLNDAINKITINDIPTLIDPTTVTFKSITDPTGTRLISQSYFFDLINQQKMLDRVIGQEIVAEQIQGNSKESYTGKLLSTKGGLILENKDKTITSLANYSSLRFPNLPDGFWTKPALVWNISTEKPGKHKVESTYQTAGMTWWVDYNAVLDNNKLELSAWVSIINKSGINYDNAQLKLIAGDVHQATPRMKASAGLVAMASNPMPTPQFSEKSFAEYHLYQLERLIDLPNNSTQQIELFSKGNNIPVTQEYYYFGAKEIYYGQVAMSQDLGNTGNTSVDVYLKFKNSKKDGLGIPMPSGIIRIGKRDPKDGSIELVGEDTIDHTPINEEITIKMGSAFDITGERKQTNFNIDSKRQTINETIEITLKNHKTEDVKIIVRENLFRAPNWQIVGSNKTFEKHSADTIEIPVTVPSNSEERITFTVRYQW